MRIDFDPEKDSMNILKHGVSLARASEFEMAVAVEDTRFDYGETRFQAYGFIEGKAYCLVFTVQPQGIRAISLRRARLREMKRYVP